MIRLEELEKKASEFVDITFPTFKCTTLKKSFVEFYLKLAREENLDPFGEIYLSDVQIENRELREQIDKMKRCGNCRYLTYNMGGDRVCKLHGDNISYTKFCNDWKIVE